MKRTIKLAVAAAVALTSTVAFATNGDSLIGTGAKARGMGGAGIAMSHGAESALINPAMITSEKGSEVSFGGTVFMPNVNADMGLGEGAFSSKANLSIIPEVAIAQKVSDNFYWGIGMYGVAGMGTDYRDHVGSLGATSGNFSMVSNLQLMQFAVPLAYKADGLSLGVSPILQYGSLDINYRMDMMGGAAGSTKGVAQDFGIGYNLGASYQMGDATVGLTYKSAIDMEYKGQISVASAEFSSNTLLLSDHLEQPAEMGAGVAYKFGNSTITADYKKIKWSAAKGYKDFKWDDQNVYIVGYEYAEDSWALRAGYNHAKSPIKDQGAAGFGPIINTFNLLGFPAIVENHYTIGGTYDLTKATSLDLAYVYVPKVTNTFANVTGQNITTTHSQNAASAQVNFKF